VRRVHRLGHEAREEPPIHRQFVLLAAALVLLICSGIPPTPAGATECPAVRTAFTSFGVAMLVEPGTCALDLREGATTLRWDRAARSPELLAESIEPFLDGFSLWHYDERRHRWTAWGPNAPRGVPAITELQTGGLYFIDSPAPATWDLRFGGVSVFEDRQVVSFYGYPGIRGMGILGRYEAADAIEAVKEQAAAYDELNGEMGVVPALHPIVAVGQRYPTADGSYLYRMPEWRLEAYVEAARAGGALLILDIQVGWSEPVDEVRRLERFLLEPFVHVALDPEFATKDRGVAPGQKIGSLHADQINAVQAYLAELVAEHGLPRKALVVHQFLRSMIREPELLGSVSEVDLVISMDGFGGRGIKLLHYDWYALSEYAEYPAIKLFYEWDTPLMSPEEIQGFEVPPALIIYQ